MVYPRFSYIIWTRKNYISFKSNNKQASKWRKNLKTAFLYQCILELLYFEYGCLVGQPRRGRGRGGEGGGTDEQHLSDKPPLIHVEKLTVPGRSTLPQIVLLQAFNSWLVFYHITFHQVFAHGNRNSTESSSILPP